MNRRLFLGLVLTTVLAGTFALAFSIQAVKASGAIYIRADESGNGMVTAFFRQSTVAYTLSLGSREDCGCGSNVGTIVFDGVVYSLPQNISKEAGTYSIRYDAGSGYEFSQWETSGEASITDYYDSSTTVTVNGNSTVVAIYTKASYIVNLDSLEGTQVTSHLGNITLAGVTYSLPSWTSKTSGIYPIRFNVPSGYEFDHWETIGGLKITNVNALSTWVVPSGNGNATGVYKKSTLQPPVYDLALIGIDIPSNSAMQGQMLPINVTVMNEGTNDEVCNLTMYANDTEFYSVQQILTHGETRTISLDWNTSDLLGNYTLRAYARLLAGELHIDDNNLIYQPAITIEKAYVTSDLNKDGTINIQDITIVAVAFGSNPGDPKWNVAADVDKNGTINIVDISMVARDYGKTA